MRLRLRHTCLGSRHTYLKLPPCLWHCLGTLEAMSPGFPCWLQLVQTYEEIRGSILAGEYEPVSAFSCQQGHTSYTAADLPTKGQVSEAAYAASQASAGRLAALTSQVWPPRSPPHTPPLSLPPFPLQLLADRHSLKT